MKNKVMITGLGLGQDIGLCDVCNFDISWLVNNPTNILWADEILFANSFMNSLTGPSENKQEKATKFVFEQLEYYGFLKRYSVKDYINADMAKLIEKQVENDISTILEKDSRCKMKDDHFLVMEGQEYCGPVLGTIYASIILSRMLNANCIYDKNTKYFIEKKLDLYSLNIIEPESNKVFNELFQIFLPETPIFPIYFYCSDEKCNECKRRELCKKNLEYDIEQNIKNIVEVRNRDEFYQFREFINKYNEKTSIQEKEIKDYVAEVNKDIRRIKIRINKNFPQYKRIINLISLISVPISIAGTFLSQPVLSIAPLISTGIAQCTNLLIENYSSKNNWITFINEKKKSQ
jgi:hypothetical protein